MSNGHVAYVEQVISDTEIIVSEDYWGGDFYWRRVTKSGGGWPTGFIHFNDRVVAPTTAPAIVGSPAVGAPLEVAAGAWTPTPTSVTVRWLADGAAIPGATAPGLRPHTRREGQGPHRRGDGSAGRLHRRASRSRHRSRRPGAFQPTELPAIQGVAEVGQTLTLTTSSWSPQPAKVKTQWYADGVAVPGATGASLVLTRDHIDRRISARVTASASGYRKSTSTAPETTPVLAKPIAITSPSRVKGTPEVGRRLVARVGSVKPTDATATYAWLRDGQPIAKATNPTYTVRRADLGRGLSVQITLTRRHFRSTTESVAVAPVTTVPEVKVRTDATRKRVAVDIRVSRSRSVQAGRGDDRQRGRTHGGGPGRQWEGAGRRTRRPAGHEAGGRALCGDRRRAACSRAFERQGAFARLAAVTRRAAFFRGPSARGRRPDVPMNERLRGYSVIVWRGTSPARLRISSTTSASGRVASTSTPAAGMSSLDAWRRTMRSRSEGLAPHSSVGRRSSR